jgi:uncharacterized protein (DUF362 family)
MRRRQFLAGAAAAASAMPMLGATPAFASAQASRRAQGAARAAEPEGLLGVPGPYPGQVIEARNPGMIRAGKKDRDAIRATLGRALTELTGADAPIEGWRTFFEPGDVVGIKVVPNGHPQHPTSPELILEVIAGLEAAGVKRKDMVVFDRYESEFLAAGYQDILPDGVAFGGLTAKEGDGSQLKLAFESDRTGISGYDPDEFVEMNLVSGGHDPKDDRAYRSHLGLLVTRRLNKVVCLPCLKDHGASGVTGCLKNMSHGFVNNVERSHSTPSSNATNTFIPSIVQHPIIREKCVLQIMDGIRGIWQGGPFGNNADWAWDYNALLVGTDPVAIDHVEWDIIDAKRKEMGVPGVGAVGKLAADPFNREGFDIRQPQHIALAGNLGLGFFDYKSPQGRRKSINHRVVQVG